MLNNKLIRERRDSGLRSGKFIDICVEQLTFHSSRTGYSASLNYTMPDPTNSSDDAVVQQELR